MRFRDADRSAQLAPNTSVFLSVWQISLNHQKLYQTQKMLRLRFNFALDASPNPHIVRQYVARLLPVSVKSQNESSQQADGLEMRHVSEDI